MKRTVLLVVAVLSLVVGVVMAGIGALLWIVYGTSGTVTVDAGRVESQGRARAVITDLVRVNSQVPFSGSLGGVTLGAASPAGSPMFIGYAPPADVDTYLMGKAYTVATASGDGGWTYTDVPGRGTPAAPASAGIWTASATGTPAEIELRDLAGPVTLVVMNPDASTDVAAGLTLTYRSQTVFPMAVGLLVGGGVVVLLGLALLVWGRRQPKTGVAVGKHAAAATVAAVPVAVDGTAPDGGAAAVGTAGDAAGVPAPAEVPAAAEVPPAADAVAAGAGVPSAASPAAVVPPEQAVPTPPAPVPPVPPADAVDPLTGPLPDPLTGPLPGLDDEPVAEADDAASPTGSTAQPARADVPPEDGPA